MLHCVCGLGARWDVGSPKIARSCGALSKRSDFPSCAWPRAGSLPQDLLLKLAVFPHAVCPAYVISSCLRKWRDQNHSLKNPIRFGEVPFKLLFYGKGREKKILPEMGALRERTLDSFLCDAAVRLLMNINCIRHLQRLTRKLQRWDTSIGNVTPPSLNFTCAQRYPLHPLSHACPCHPREQDCPGFTIRIKGVGF